MPDSPVEVWMVGPFPPPVHGMSAVNDAVRDLLLRAGVRPHVIDVAAPSLSNRSRARLARLPRAARGLIRLVGAGLTRPGVLYMSLSGGWGQLYELGFLLIARARRLERFVHHHSFAYLDSPRWLSRALVWVAGRDATHVVLCEHMEGLLRSVYGAKNVTVMSNASLVAKPRRDTVVANPRSQLRTIGMIGSLTEEKGVPDFLELVGLVQAAGLPVHARLAGPFSSEETKRRVLEQADRLHIDYLGPIYGESKEQFLRHLDVLVLPTRYANEAEPLVVLEALAHGTPVIAFGRGCIPGTIPPECGLVIDPGKSFSPAAIEQIRTWLREPARFAAASRAARTQYEAWQTKSNQQWEEILGRMTTSSGKERSA